MCGITGKICFRQNSKIVSTTEIEKMNERIVHRGPDDGGAWISDDGKIGLGHRRLAIIDLSPAGHQPMHFRHRNKKYTVVFNGEIYNFREKRYRLEKEGYEFRSESDTEVIMALYDRYGVNCLKHLRGMFAFALYDHQKNILFCARDRLGKKPFKFYKDNEVFIFASELKAILTQPEYKREPDFSAIYHYLTLQYVPAPLTGFKNIRKLEPAHYMIVDCATGTVKKECYWRLDYDKKLSLSEAEWERKIIDELEEAVKLRMIADVPLGAFLSGGIDSSAVVALMARNSDKPIKTFSIGFEEVAHDERHYARMIAEKYGTDHTEFVVKPNAVEILPKLVRHYEEPYADSSALPTYYLAQMTRKYVTVALNGDGGDENFAGYTRYSIQKFSLWYEYLAKPHNLLLKPLLKAASKNLRSPFLHNLNRFTSRLSEDYRHRYLSAIEHFSTEMKKQLLANDFGFVPDTAELIVKLFNEAETSDKIDQMLYVDINSYLPGDLLVKVDIATMAHGLESRSPFLDHKFMETTAQIPTRLKLKGFNNKKYILKKALQKDLVPKEILHRRKQGFGVPLDRWFRGPLKNFAYDILLSGQAKQRGVFHPAKIKELLDDHQTGPANYAPHIWSLLVLEMWFREYFD